MKHCRKTTSKYSPRQARGFVSRLMLGLLVLACLAIGLLGVVLPLIPGLLFLLFAAVAAAQLSPRFEGWLRRFPATHGYLRQGSRISRLGLADKCRYCFWVSLQVTVDALRAVGQVFRTMCSRGRSSSSG